MSTFTKFAVAGGLTASTPHSANVGTYIINSLLSQKAAVRALVREESINHPKVAEFKNRGVEITPINYQSQESLVKALQGIDVVISTVGAAGIGAQGDLAQAAKEAGVKLFAPSEFGISTVGKTPETAVYGKTKLHETLKDLGLPYTLFTTGGFANMVAAFLGAKDKTVNVVGDGNQPITFTALEDIGDYVAYVLTHAEPSQIANKELRIQGSKVTFNELIQAYEAKHNTQLAINTIPVESAWKRWEEEHDFLSYIFSEFARGGGLVIRKPEEDDSKLYPGWNPRDVTSFL